jgi:hypothetical protein
MVGYTITNYDFKNLGATVSARFVPGEFVPEHNKNNLTYNQSGIGSSPNACGGLSGGAETWPETS